MSEKDTIKPEQAQVLRELEHLIGESLPYGDKIEWDDIRVQVEGENIIGLGLYQCRLTALPESFGELESLKTLYLGKNQLTALPESFGQLKLLKTLELWDNQLTALPNSFGQLESLREIRLDNNHLKTLPESFGRLKGLNMIILSGNQWKRCWKKIVKKDLFEILEFCRTKAAEREDILAKIAH